MSKLNIQNKLLSILDDEINDLEYQLFNVNCLSKSIKKSIAKKKKERNAVEASVLGNNGEDKESLKEQLISRHKKLTGKDIDPKFEKDLDRCLVEQ